jgi:hypothetical protein
MKEAPVRHRAVPLTLTLPAQPDAAMLRWESPVLGTRYTRFVSPYPPEHLTLVTRTLDMVQSQLHPRAVFAPADYARLTTMGLWDNDTADPLHIIPRRVGHRLYQALTADPAGAQALATLRDYATVREQPIALHIRIPPTATALAALPWELLWDERPLPLLLSQGRAAACTRYLDFPQAVPAPAPPRSPLRILAVAPHARMASAVREAEQAARHKAWERLCASGQVIMRECSPATPAALIDALHAAPPDVIHFYGHGRYTNGGATLLLDDASGNGQWIAADQIAAVAGGTRMVVLLACQSATIDPHAGMASALAPLLSAAGVPVVLGMNVSFRVTAAVRATAIMYRALVAGWSVQQAVALARQALYVEESDRASWSVPVLYLRAAGIAPVHLVQPPQRHTAAVSQPVPAAHQQVRATHNSQIAHVHLHGGTHAAQTMQAHRGSQILRARIRAQRGNQEMRAEEHSTIRDADLAAE